MPPRFTYEPLFHDPAYRMMVVEIRDKRLALIEYLIARGDWDGAEEELNRFQAELEATPDGWQIRKIEALKARGEFTLEKVQEVEDEAERRRAEWLGWLGG